MNKESVKGLLLEDLWELCYRAHSNTSFSPEKRATQYVTDYSNILESDLKELGDNSGNYKAKFIEKFSSWMSAKGRCLSSMITGPSNFPVRKAQKANNAERNHYESFDIWRTNYFKAVNRVPRKSPEDELDIAERRLETLTNFQLEVKEINIAIRKFKSDDLSKIIDHLLMEEYSKDLISLIDLRGGKYKIPSFTLTNNNATIKRTQEKITIMNNRIDRKTSWIDIEFEGGKVILEDDRLKIFHDSKPENEIITEIKSNGFRWSPFWKCWCRQHTGNAIYAMKNLSFIKK